MPGEDVYQDFVQYQTALLNEFRQLADRYHFQAVDATGAISEVFTALRREMEQAVAGMLDEIPERTRL